MPLLLFRLNGVPEDEADEVRVLLDSNGIDFYETSAGNWRISLAAIWLNNEDQYQRARELIDEYQLERGRNARQAFLNSGRHAHPSFLVRARRNPIRYLIYLLIVAVVLYFSTIPFFYFSDWLGVAGG